MEESSQIYFARLYTLLCDDAGRQVVVQDWFPSKYKSKGLTDKKTIDAVRNRRSQFYSVTRKKYRLLRNDEGEVVGLEKLDEADIITAEEDEQQRSMSFLALSIANGNLFII